MKPGSSLALGLSLLRGQAARAWLFLFCIAVGVAARVSVSSFLVSLDQALGREARVLLGADVELSGPSALDPLQAQKVERALPKERRQSSRVSLLTMASSGEGASARSRLVQLAAVDQKYPLVGTLSIEGVRTTWTSADLQGKAWVFVQPELCAQLGISIGSRLRLGRNEFEVAGLIRSEPGLGAGAFALGPRVLLGLDQLEATGLLEPGGRRSHELLVALPDPAQGEAVAEALRQALGLGEPRRARMMGGGGPPREGLRVRGVRNAQGDLRRFFERLADYLGLVSLMALLLGGVGVASVTRSFVRDSAPHLGVLRSLGAGPWAQRKVFFWQSAALGLAGGLLGGAIGLALQGLLPAVLKAFLPVDLRAAFSLGSLAWGLALALCTAIAFGMEPVLAAEGQSPASLLRDEDPPAKVGPLTWGWRLGVAVLFALLAAWESSSWTRGPGGFGLLLAGALLLQVAAWGLLPLLAGLRKAPLPMGFRHGLGNLGRPGLRAGATVVSLGCAALLLGSLAMYERSLLAELDPGKDRSKLPDFFLIDIQREQTEPLRQWARERGLDLDLSPMVKARYRGKADKPVDEAGTAVTREEEDARFMRSREQNLSWRPGLGKGETLIAGQWMDVNGNKEVEASLEERFAERLEAKLGDTLRFDVQGVEVQARVTSLRKVHWASFQPNFFILLSPWAIQDAPQTWIGSAQGAGSASERAQIQAALAQSYPNVTLFDVAEGTQKILSILDKIMGAVRLVAAFSLAAGLVVLAGLALATARARRNEAALLKVLGASRRQLLQAAGVEFGALAGLASFLGLALSVLLARLVLAQALELPFVVHWGALAQLWALFTGTGALVGLLATLNAYRAKPAELLRAEA